MAKGWAMEPAPTGMEVTLMGAITLGYIGLAIAAFGYGF